ncbi:MAG: hypothetical protein ACKO2N_21615, partial [Tabrizicola sp.]
HAKTRHCGPRLTPRPFASSGWEDVTVQRPAAWDVIGCRRAKGAGSSPVAKSIINEPPDDLFLMNA